MMSSLMATLGLDVKPFIRGMSDARNAAREEGEEIQKMLGNTVGNALARFTVPTAAIATGLEAIHKVLESNAELAEKAKGIDFGAERLNVSIERFQDLKHAAEISNTTIDAVYAAFRKLAQGAISAENGNKELEASFNTLGISVANLKRSSVDEIFQAITSNVRESALTTERLSAIMKTMGRSADELIPGMRRGAFDSVDMFAKDAETIKARAEFAEDKKVLKAALADMWDAMTSFGTHGPVQSFTHWLAGAFRTQTEQMADKRPLPDMKSMSKAELEAEAKADKERESSAKRAVAIEERISQKRAENALAGLSTAEKLLAVKKREHELERTIQITSLFGDLFHKDGSKRERVAKLELELEDKHSERTRLEKEKLAEDDRKARKAESEAESVLRIKQETAHIEREGALREMTAGERVLELQQRIQRVKAEIADSVDDLDEAQSQKNLAELQNQLAGAKQQADSEAERAEAVEEKGDSAHLLPTNVTERQRIGAFAPAAQSSLANIGQQTNQHLSEMLKELRGLNKTVKGGTKF